LASILDRLHDQFGRKVIQWGRSHMASHLK
jgi:hypothetical protein